jgi:hypothetical protein
MTQAIFYLLLLSKIVINKALLLVCTYLLVTDINLIKIARQLVILKNFIGLV